MYLLFRFLNWITKSTIIESNICSIDTEYQISLLVSNILLAKNMIAVLIKSSNVYEIFWLSFKRMLLHICLLLISCILIF